MIMTELDQIEIGEGSKLLQVSPLLNSEGGNNYAHRRDQDMCMLSVRHLTDWVIHKHSVRKGRLYGSRKVPPVMHHSLEVVLCASVDCGF
jgi:hypothetical protein